MAIAADATAQTAGGATSNPVTWSHTCSGANRALIVAIGTNGYIPSSVNYGGVAMSSLGTQNESNTGYRVSLYRLVAPASGANTISASFSTTPAFSVRSMSFTGVDPTTPNGVFASTANSGTSNPSLSVASSAGDLVVDALTWNQFSFPATESVGAQQTVQGGASTGSFVRTNTSSESGSATTTMSWAFSANTNWAYCGIALKPVATGGGGGGPIAWATSNGVQNTTPSATIVITKPGGTVDGDLLFAALTWTSGTDTVTAAPVGWTLIGNTTTGVSNEIYVASYYRIASSEGVAYTWTLAGAINGCGTIWRITGAHATTPFVAYSGKTGLGSNIVGSAVETTVNNALVAFIAGVNCEEVGPSFSTPSGYTVRDNFLTTGVSLEGTFSRIQAGAGTTGNITTVLTNAIAGDQWATQVVVFKPTDTPVDDRQDGITCLPPAMQTYATHRWPMSYTAFSPKDITATILLPSPCFAWSDLPFEFHQPSFAESWPQDYIAVPLSSNSLVPAPAPIPAPTPSGIIEASRNNPRVSLPPQTLADDPQWQRQAAAWIGEANQGHLQNTGVVTLNASQNSTVIVDDRAGINTFIGLMPRTANAATELGSGTLYISAQGKQTFTITHANNAQTDRTFVYTLLG